MKNFAIIGFIIIAGTAWYMQPQVTNKEVTVVLSTPSIHNEYYAEVFDQIIDFHVDYANTIYGNDNVILLTDADTAPLLESRVPAEIVRVSNVEDIWMRDFTTVNPHDPVQFLYEGEYFEDIETPRFIQESFNNFLSDQKINVRQADYILDGGNVVDNYTGSIVVSERFLEENELSEAEGREVLKREYGAEYVAIIPYDDDVMGHADGMVMFVDDVLFVNQYDEPFRTNVMTALNKGLPNNIIIVEVEADFEIKEWKDFSSACGVNVNSLVTKDHIYVPTFGNTTTDKKFIETLKQYTNKTIHEVDAQGVCFMGGSVRCLSHQSNLNFK